MHVLMHMHGAFTDSP